MITTVRLRGRLEKSLECSLPATVAFEYPTIESLTTYLANDILKLASTTDESPGKVSGYMKESQTPLSESELLSRLDDELAAFKKLTDETL